MRRLLVLSALAAGLLAPEFSVAKPGMPFEAQSGEAMRLLGFTAFGSVEEIAALESEIKALASVGVKTARPETLDGRIELMILFAEEVGPITVALIHQKITDGRLGHFEYESILAPETAVK